MEIKGKMKVVGRREPRHANLESMEGFLEMVLTIRGNKPFAPRGLFRFRTHEEADEWMMKMLTRASAGPQR